MPVPDSSSRSRKTEPRDDVAAPGLDKAPLFEPPQPGYREQVFYHDLVADTDRHATAMIRNDALDIGVFVHYRQDELPRFIEWKMMGSGTYVVGMEPANCGVWGRAKERASGTLQFLQPGEDRHFAVHIGVVDGHSALDEYTSTNNLA